jgi:hypothetical protein
MIYECGEPQWSDIDRRKPKNREKPVLMPLSFLFMYGIILSNIVLCIRKEFVDGDEHHF